MVRLLAWIALSLSIERSSTVTEGSGAKDASRTFDDQNRARGQDWLGDLGQEERRELLTWVGQNLTEVRQTALGQRPVYWILWLGLAVGLVAYAAGYLIKASTPTEPLGLVGDLLYTFGWALWTGSRRGGVPPDHPGDEAAPVQEGTRCLRGIDPRSSRGKRSSIGGPTAEGPINQRCTLDPDRVGMVGLGPPLCCPAIGGMVQLWSMHIPSRY